MTAATAGPAAEVGSPDLTIFLRITVVSALFGAGIIHVMWTSMHFHEWPAAGAFFLAVAALQTSGGFAVAALPGRATYLAGIAVNAMTVAVWSVSRTTGMPVGPDAGQRATIGMPDLVATLFELLIVLALFPLLRGCSATGGRYANGGRMTRRVYLLLAAIPVYVLVFTCLAVVPAAAGHGGR